MEAASIAGHLGLGRLVYFYDDNHITIDGTTALSFTTEDKGKRFEAHGWHVQSVADSEDVGALERATRAAQAEEERPSLIIVRSHIAYGAPQAIDTSKSHGSPLGEDEIRAAKEALGLDPDKHFDVPDEVYEHMDARPAGIEAEQEWQRPLRALGGGVPEAPRGLGGRPHRQAAARLDRGAADVPGGRGGRHARRGQEGDAGVQALHADDDRRRRRPRRVDEDRVRGLGRLLRDARRPQHRLRHPRARDGLDRERDRADAGDAEALRLDVPDLLRLHAARPCGSRRSATCSRSGRGRTTRSRSARTAPPTSPSSTTWRSGRSRTSGTSGPATRTRRRWRGGSRSSAKAARSRWRCRARRCRRSTCRPRARCAAPTPSGSRATGCPT